MAYNKVVPYSTTPNFLESEVGLVLKTFMGEKTKATDVDDRKIIKAGSVYPDNKTGAKGIVFEDVDMTYDDKRPISVIVAGRIFKDRLPVALDATAQGELEKIGFVFLDTPEVTFMGV